MAPPASEKQRLAAFKPVLELRAKLLMAIRRFFLEHGYLEVETPVAVRTPALELHIDACPAGNGYLRTSPELHMKRLLCAGYERIFQIGPCFRSGERGNLHNPEFTMLEWYRLQADYMDILAETKDLLRYVAKACLGKMIFERRSQIVMPRLRGEDDCRLQCCHSRESGNPASLLNISGFPIGSGMTENIQSPITEGLPQIIDLGAEWLSFSVPDLFKKFAGWNPEVNFDSRRFEADLVNCIEPRLPKDRPVVLHDYPAEAAALARLKADNRRLAERWELYLGGIEIANAFSELTNAAEQRKRFEECALKRLALGKEAYEFDVEFLAALETGMPSCAGIALGIDRLVMLFAGVDLLEDVLAFR